MSKQVCLLFRFRLPADRTAGAVVAGGGSAVACFCFVSYVPKTVAAAKIARKRHWSLGFSVAVVCVRAWADGGFSETVCDHCGCRQSEVQLYDAR